MPHINITPLVAGDLARASDLNSRFNTIQGLVNGSLDSSNLADNAVTSGKIADGSVATSKLADSAVTAAKIVNNTITSNKFAPGAVAGAALGSGSVTSDKLADPSVTSSKLAPGAVTTPAIANAAVNRDKIQDGEVTNLKLADGAVSVDKIEDGQVTLAKLANRQGLSVIGRQATGTGPSSSIVAESNHQVLRRFGSSLGFGQVATDGIADGAVGTDQLDTSERLSQLSNVDASTVPVGGLAIILRAGLNSPPVGNTVVNPVRGFTYYDGTNVLSTTREILMGTYRVIGILSMLVVGPPDARHWIALAQRTS